MLFKRYLTALIGYLVIFTSRNINKVFGNGRFSSCFLPLHRVALLFKVRANKQLDMRQFDEEVERLAPMAQLVTRQMNSTRVAILASVLLDMGGHTKCIRDLIKAIQDDFKCTLFLTQYNASYRHAPNTMVELKKYCENSGSDLNVPFSSRKIIELFQCIVKNNPKVVFSFINPNDVAGATVLALLKKYTGIKILFCPHASHFPNLGMRFADLVIEGFPMAAHITQKMRKIQHVNVVGLLSKKIADCQVYSEEDIKVKRDKIGITTGHQCTMSGGAAYKFFDNKNSDYFEMIKCLLERNTNIQHVILSEFTNEQVSIIHNIFSGSNAVDRLIFLPFSNDYELFFLCADVFIDSFPVSSALTQIDLMRLRVPSVVKINRDNLLFSFHQYQSKDYRYIFEDSKVMLQGIEILLSNKAERDRIVEENFKHYMLNFEGSVVAKRIKKIIYNADSIDSFIETIE